MAHGEAEALNPILLFDEIEKASDALWQLLLGILDKATLTLGDNRRGGPLAVHHTLTSLCWRGLI